MGKLRSKAEELWMLNDCDFGGLPDWCCTLQGLTPVPGSAAHQEQEAAAIGEESAPLPAKGFECWAKKVGSRQTSIAWEKLQAREEAKFVHAMQVVIAGAGRLLLAGLLPALRSGTATPAVVNRLFAKLKLAKSIHASAAEQVGRIIESAAIAELQLYLPLKEASAWLTKAKKPDYPAEVKKGIARFRDEIMAKPYWNDLAQDMREAVSNVIRKGAQTDRDPEKVIAKVKQLLGPEGTRARAERIAITECLPGDAVVNGALVTAAYRRWYEGPMVKIVTNAGREFTGTPNHPVLTVRGWVALGDLTKRDYLICNRTDVQFPGVSSNHDVEAPPLTISQVFDTLSAVVVIERERTGKPDFHGDGADGYVDILRPDRALLFGRFSPVDEFSVNRLLAPSDSRAVLLAANSAPFARDVSIYHFHRLVKRSHLTAASFDSSADGAFQDSMFFGHRSERYSSVVLGDEFVIGEIFAEAAVSGFKQCRSCFGWRSDFDADSLASSQDSACVASKNSGYRRPSHSGQVQLDRVVGLVFIECWHGYVFNLTTVDGYFAANEVYTGNTTGAVNAGAQAGREYLAERGFVKGKEWVTTIDGHERAAHARAHGQQRKVDGLFIVGGRRCRFPGDPSLPAALRVRCRCRTRDITVSET